ncbi:MAG: CPBP family intramembrane metalloprotease [Methanomassiliicoccaceae archaeon]|nr:CPBP family intramembrane metalloprotease [Methanomassiliicoccaceae archaeon]
MSEDQRCDCGEAVGTGYRYCTRCGLPVKEPDKTSKAVRIVGILLLLLCVPMLFFEVYTLLWGAGDIWNNINYAPILILTPSPVIAFWFAGILAKLFFLFLVTTVLASFVFLLYDSRGGILDLLKGKTEKIAETPLYAVITLFAAVISFNLIFNMIIISTGNEPAVPDTEMSLWVLMYNILNAVVWEEVLCRVFMIGVPMMLFALIMNRRGSWKCLFGRFEMNAAAVALIFISSAVFSYAHLSGWDVFKLMPTFVAGLALGYLFVKYGIHAAIMLHFIINFLSSATWMFGETTTVLVFLGMFLITVVILGIVFIVWYTVRGTKFLRDMIRKAES